MPDAAATTTPDWIQPPQEQEGLQRFVDVVRERKLLIGLVLLITVGIAVLYVATATKQYEADTDLLVTPVTGDDPVLTSLGLIRESADPTRDVETASRLVANIDVAERVKKRLNSDLSPQDLLDKVAAEPVAQSNIVAVTGRETSPEGAQQLANSFAEAAVANRTDTMHDQIDELLPRLKIRAAGGGSTGLGTTTPSLDAQIDELQLLRSGADPTMRVETRASRPSTAVSPRPTLSIAAAIFAGLILGVGSAFASQLLDPRLRREEQLRRLFRLPILGRIPLDTAARSTEKPLVPRRMAPATAEAYRTLRATLTTSRRNDEGRVILVTGSSPAEGKTTTAINLATSFAGSGQRVILIESDLRRPAVADALGSGRQHGGVVSVLIENTTLAEALTPSGTYGSNLQLLTADYEGGWIAELFSIPSAEEMIRQARQLADYVIIDSPPINEVVDTLPLAKLADDVLIVVRLGTTRIDKLGQLGELLAENDIQPAGIAVVGTSRSKRSAYLYYAGTQTSASDPDKELQLVGKSEADS